MVRALIDLGGTSFPFCFRQGSIAMRRCDGISGAVDISEMVDGSDKVAPIPI